MSTRRKLEECLGEYIGKDGEEDRYQCLLCDTKALHVNPKKKKWWCNSCGVWGYIYNGLDAAPYGALSPYCPIGETSLHAEPYRDDYSPPRPKLVVGKDVRDVPASTLELLSCYATPDGLSEVHLDLLGPGAQVVGTHFYNDKWLTTSYNIKYRTLGERGIAYYFPYGRGWYQGINTLSIVLFEGLFDYLSVAKMFVDIKPPTCADVLMFVFTVGDNLTPAQVTTIQTEIYGPEEPNYKASWFIAYDNDLIQPVIKAMRTIHMMDSGDIHLLLPPSQYGKDWDDVVKKNRSHAFYTMGTLSTRSVLL